MRFKKEEWMVMTWEQMARILEGGRSEIEKDHPSICNSHSNLDGNQILELIEAIDEQHAEDIAEAAVSFSADFNLQRLRNKPEEVIIGMYFRLAVGTRFCRLLHEIDSAFTPNDGEEHTIIQRVLINVWHEFYPAAIKVR
jgi:hypothetical protein